jgi:hypothetical protein
MVVMMVMVMTFQRMKIHVAMLLTAAFVLSLQLQRYMANAVFL